MSKILKAASMLALVLCCFISVPEASAVVKPHWVRQSEDALNRKRISENYTFKVFHTFDADLAFLRRTKFDPLKTYVRTLYNADAKTMTLDSLVSVDSGEVTYRVMFKDAEGEGVVYARQVDEFCYFDDFETNEYGFNLYQLFAVSDKNIMPVFDTFVVKENANATAAALSIIPGVGQIYKGDKLKGYGIIASEAALATGAIFSHYRYRKCEKNFDNKVANYDSWKSKATGWKVARNVGIGTFASVWVYNILDAAILPGGSRVVVKKPEGQQLTISPSSTSAGVALTYRF
ncbi:MAG: hypothetical protein J6L98_00775 [Bacteroidales bacterium]|nr:hypothetical protein [Bacteroidales bacterium]